MKKFLAVLISLFVTITSVCPFAFAEASPIQENDEQLTSITTEQSEIQPREFIYLYQYSGYIRLQMSNTFTINSKGNLYFVMASSYPCTVHVYKKNILLGDVLVKEIYVPGDMSAHKYLIKNNASTGEYSFKVNTDNYDCYSTFNFYTTEYI